MKKSAISKFISITLKVTFVLGIVSLFFIPRLYNMFPELKVSFEDQTVFYQIAFYICAIGSLGIVYELIRIFDNIYKGSPFKKQMVINLKIIAILFMFLSLIITTKTVFMTTLLSVVVSFVTFIVSLCFYVLSQIFKSAVEYKNEVDLTV